MSAPAATSSRTREASAIVADGWSSATFGEKRIIPGGSGVLGSVRFGRRLLEEAGVALVPGGAFGDGGYVRLSYATSDELLETAVRRIAAAVR